MSGVQLKISEDCGGGGKWALQTKGVGAISCNKKDHGISGGLQVCQRGAWNDETKPGGATSDDSLCPFHMRSLESISW